MKKALCNHVTTALIAVLFASLASAAEHKFEGYIVKVKSGQENIDSLCINETDFLVRLAKYTSRYNYS